jgi:hypothetical protein
MTKGKGPSGKPLVENSTQDMHTDCRGSLQYLPWQQPPVVLQGTDVLRQWNCCQQLSVTSILSPSWLPVAALARCCEL